MTILDIGPSAIEAATLSVTVRGGYRVAWFSRTVPPEAAPETAAALWLTRFRIQVGEDLPDDLRLLNEGDDPHCPAAGPAYPDVHVENTLQALHKVIGAQYLILSLGALVSQAPTRPNDRLRSTRDPLRSPLSNAWCMLEAVIDLTKVAPPTLRPVGALYPVRSGECA